MDDPRTIEVDEFLPHSTALVWRALTDPALLSRWLMPNDFQPTVGHRFTFHTTPIPDVDFDGVVHCEVLDIEPEKSLRIAWRGGAALDTTVTWTLAAEGTGTRLFLVHDGFDPDNAIHQTARRTMSSGWRSNLLRRLSQCLAALPT
jgi:uncharacterized protein YndB with AHSA1/START domain